MLSGGLAGSPHPISDGHSAARNDVDYVATEFGAVRLFGLDLKARAEALINLAAPAFRSDLRVAWRECLQAMGAA